MIDFHGGFNYTYLPVLTWLNTEVPESAWLLIDPIMDVLLENMTRSSRAFTLRSQRRTPGQPNRGCSRSPRCVRGVPSEVLFASMPAYRQAAVQLIMLQMSYEFGTLCTSIAANQANSACEVHEGACS